MSENVCHVTQLEYDILRQRRDQRFEVQNIQMSLE